MVWIGKRDAGYLRWALTQFNPPDHLRPLHNHIVQKLGAEIFAQQQQLAQQAKGITPAAPTGGIRPIQQPPRTTPPSNPDQERERIKKLQEAMGGK